MVERAAPYPLPWLGRNPAALLPILAVVALAMVPTIADATDNGFLVRLFTRVVIFAIVAVALNFVLGFGGLVSMVHGALFGIGSYVVAILAHHEHESELLAGFAGTTNLAITVPLAIVVVCAVSALIGLITLRTSGLYFIMITLAFNQMFFYFFSGLERYGGSDGLQILTDLNFLGWSMPGRTALYYICLAALVVTLLILGRVVRSRFGAAIVGAKQNERRLTAIGIEPFPYRLLAFAISGAFCGLAGALWASSQGFVSPADMSWMRSGEFVIIAVLGGMSRIWGPMLGAVVFLSLEAVLSDWTTYWQLPVGLGIIVIVTFFRDGIAGALTAVRTRHA